MIKEELKAEWAQETKQANAADPYTGAIVAIAGDILHYAP